MNKWILFGIIYFDAHKGASGIHRHTALTTTPELFPPPSADIVSRRESVSYKADRRKLLRLNEIEAVRGPWGFKIKIDPHFGRDKPLSEWVTAAQQLGRIPRG